MRPPPIEIYGILEVLGKVAYLVPGANGGYIIFLVVVGSARRDLHVIRIWPMFLAGVGLASLSSPLSRPEYTAAQRVIAEGRPRLLLPAHGFW